MGGFWGKNWDGEGEFFFFKTFEIIYDKYFINGSKKCKNFKGENHLLHF